MSKILFIFFAFLFIFNINYFCNFTSVSAESDIYYRITSENSALYKTPTTDDSLENIYFILPSSYFVKYINTFDENFYKIEYQSLIGYIKQTDVTRVYSTPQTPYFSYSITLLNTANPIVYSLPSIDSTYLGNIPFNATTILCLGQTKGQEFQGSNIWYYCKYLSYEQSLLSGYIHSHLIQSISDFQENTETVLTEPTQSTSSSVLAPELTSQSNFLLILALIIPAIILLILAIKPQKRKNNKTAQRQIANLNQLNFSQKNQIDELDF